MIRRFVHLIVDDLKSSYTLRRIDTAPLFAGARKDLGMPTARPPPRPVVCFDATGRSVYDDQTEFFLLGSKIVSVSKNRRTILYDTSTSTVCAGPELRQGKGFGLSALPGQLYRANCTLPMLTEPMIITSRASRPCASMANQGIGSGNYFPRRRSHMSTSP
jgi:hypothetical protein